MKNNELSYSETMGKGWSHVSSRRSTTMAEHWGERVTSRAFRIKVEPISCDFHELGLMAIEGLSVET